MRRLVAALVAFNVALAGCGAATSSSSTTPTTRIDPTSAAAATPTPVVAPCAVPAGTSADVAWTVDGAQRAARVHRPAASDGTPAPVVIALHGYGGFAQELEGT